MINNEKYEYLELFKIETNMVYKMSFQDLCDHGSL